MDAEDEIPADLKAQINLFYDETEEALIAAANKLIGNSAPPMIYHYTTEAGLRGILESGKLWQTDILTQYDTSELRHGLNLASEAATAAAGAQNAMNSVKAFAKEFDRFVKSGLEGSANYFILCFGSERDDLSQWMEFADRGRGYTLGFDGPALEQGYSNPVDGQPFDRMTFPVSYQDAIIKDIQGQIISAAIPYLCAPRNRKSELSRKAQLAFMTELSVQISALAIRAALLFKNEAFRNQREYRFLEIHRVVAPEANFKSRDTGKKYTEFDWKSAAPGALKEIIIGPDTDRVAAQRIVEQCLASYSGGRSVSVQVSNIPYRSDRRSAKR